MTNFTYDTMKKTHFEIFISYRHDFSNDRAQLLLQLLEDSGYQNKISFDADNLEGQFNAEIINRIDNCTDFLMLIHPETFSHISDKEEDQLLHSQLCSCSEMEFNDKMKQLKDEGRYVDYVRAELGRALTKKKNIIPIVPVDSASFCFDTLRLPTDISGITGYQAVYYNDTSSSLFKEIMPRLLPKMKAQAPKPWSKWIKACISLFALIIIGLLSFYGYKYFSERQAFMKCRSYMDYVVLQNDSNHLIFYHTACMDSIRQFENLHNHGFAYINDNDNKDSISVMWNDSLSLYQLKTLCCMLNKMMYVKSGTFEMGTDQFLDIEGPAHQVTLSKDYYIYKYEVTRELWYAVMNDSVVADPDKPMTNVSWYDCQYFMSQLFRMTGLDFRLPTEAQWEYAARGGDYTHYSGSENIAKVAYYKNNSMGMIHDVGQLAPNRYELYDMSGNVKEWCFDGLSGPYKNVPVKDPVGPSTDKKIIRGGDFTTEKTDMSVMYRDTYSSHEKAEHIGFRMILILGKEQI